MPQPPFRTGRAGRRHRPHRPAVRAGADNRELAADQLGARAGCRPRGLIEQDGLADPGEFAEQFPYREIQAAAEGAQPHQVGDLQGGPVVMAGDQHVLAEDFFFQRRAGSGVDAPGQPQDLGLLAVQLPGDDAADPGGSEIRFEWMNCVFP